MDIAHRVIATAEAADLVAKSLGRTASQRDVSASQLFHAIIPAFGIRWSSDATRRIGSSRINPSRQQLRNANLPLDRYNRLTALWKDSVSNDPRCCPKQWESWRSLIERFELDDVDNLSAWIPVVRWRIDQKLPDPPPPGDRFPVATQYVDRWGNGGFECEKTVAGGSHRFRGPPSGALESMMLTRPDADSLIKAIVGADFASCGAARLVTAACHRLKVRKTFLPLGPAAKMKRPRKNHASLKTMNSFLRKPSHHIALTGVRKALPSFASGVRSYFSFCEIKGVYPFPAKESATTQRSFLFRPGSAFSNYVSYVEKACCVLNSSVACDTPAVRNTAKALQQAGKSNLRLHNFLMSKELGGGGDFDA